MNVTNPLQVLEKVFQHLAVEDLKSCRLVSKSWCAEATEALSPKVGRIPIGTPSSLRSLILLSSSSQFPPFTGFNFSSHFFSLPGWEPTFGDFLSNFSHHLESIHISLDKHSSQWTLDSNTTFPKLRQMTLIGHGLDLQVQGQGQGQDPDLLPIFTLFLSSSPKLESLSLIMDSESKQMARRIIAYMTSIKEKLRGLKRLEIYVPVGDLELTHLTALPFSLKRLECDFHRSCFLESSLEAFLKAQSRSLEYLKFDNYFGNSCYIVRFPVMENLKTLKIDGKNEVVSRDVRFHPFSYSLQFPRLRKLVLGGAIQYNTCWEILFPQDSIVESLTELKLTAPFVDMVWVGRIGKLFPRLEKLYFVLTPKNEAFARMAFKSFENVRELTIYFSGDGEKGVDHILLGREEEEEDVGLAGMKGLKFLCLKSDKSTTPHISDIAVQECLMKMESLEELVMPKFQISDGTLEQLRSRRDLKVSFT